jgi:hypothetical protein
VNELKRRTDRDYPNLISIKNFSGGLRQLGANLGLERKKLLENTYGSTQVDISYLIGLLDPNTT